MVSLHVSDFEGCSDTSIIIQTWKEETKKNVSK